MGGPGPAIFIALTFYLAPFLSAAGAGLGYALGGVGGAALGAACGGASAGGLFGVLAWRERRPKDGLHGWMPPLLSGLLLLLSAGAAHALGGAFAAALVALGLCWVPFLLIVAAALLRACAQRLRGEPGERR